MKQRTRDSIPALFVNSGALLFFQLLYCISGIILFVSISSFLTRFALRFHSYSYLTAHNAINFLFSPVTLACLAVLLLILSVLVYFDACILMTGLQATADKCRISCGQLIFSGFKRGMSLFRPRLLSACFPLVGMFLVMNSYFLYQLMFRINPYCTYLPIILKTPASRFGLAAAALLIAIYSLCHLFDFSFLFLGECTLNQARKKSFTLFRKHIFEILGHLVFLITILGISWHILRFVLSAVAAFAVSLFVPKDLRVALTLTLSFFITMLSLAFIVITGILLYTHVITILFYRYSDQTIKGRPIIYRRLIPKKPRRFLFPCAAAALLIGIVCFFYLGIYTGILRAERAVPFIQIAAHRGVSSEAPENTLPAIELSIQYLSDYVEIDVQCTEDGEVVVFHDPSLKRVTGSSRALADVTYSELTQLDAGYYFGDPYLDTPVPTLTEVLELTKGRINLIIELKRNKAGADLVQKVLALIDEYDMRYQCILQSSDYQYLSEIYDIDPDLTTGYILSNAIGNYYNNEKIDFFSVRSAFVTQTVVRNIHASGKKIYAWTVNTREEMERMKRIQVDGIITDYPIQAREIIYREKQVSLQTDVLRYLPV